MVETNDGMQRVAAYRASPGQGTSDANTDSIDKDYIDNGIAEIENFLAVKASEESLVLA